MWWRHKCESATKSSLRSLQDSWNPTPASCLCLFLFLFFKGLLWGLGAASPPLQETYGTDLLVGQASFCHVSDTENAQNFTALPSPYPLSLIILVRLLPVDICCTVIRAAPHFTWSASAFIHILSDLITKRPPRRTLMLTEGFHLSSSSSTVPTDQGQFGCLKSALSTFICFIYVE